MLARVRVEWERVVRGALEGRTEGEAAEALGVSLRTVARWVRELGIVRERGRSSWKKCEGMTRKS